MRWDLRYRIATIFAIAFAPLIIFVTIWVTSAINSGRALLNEQTQTTAQLLVKRYNQSLHKAALFYNLTKQTVEPGDCRDTFVTLFETDKFIENVLTVTDQGQVLCAANDGPMTRDFAPFDTINSNGNIDGPSSIIVRVINYDDGMRVAAVTPLWPNIKPNGSRVRTAIIFNFEGLSRYVADNKRFSDPQFISATKSGQIIYQGGMDNPSFDIQALYTQGYLKAEPGGDYIDLYYKLDPEPSRRMVKTLASIAVLFLATLIFGILTLWRGIDLMAIAPMRKLRETALLVARGQKHLRVGEIENASTSVDDVARSFDIMADRLISREAELEKSLAEKDILLREVHHRVKNNLQIIISMLNLQERRLVSAEALRALSETRTRLNVIALLHQHAYHDEAVSIVDLEELLLAVIALQKSDPEIGRTLTDLQVNIAPFSCHIEQALSLSILVSEVFNQLRYFQDWSGELVEISLVKTGPQSLTMDINIAVGEPSKWPKDQAFDQSQRFIKGIARQLPAQISQSLKNGFWTIQLKASQMRAY